MSTSSVTSPRLPTVFWVSPTSQAVALEVEGIGTIAVLPSGAGGLQTLGRALSSAGLPVTQPSIERLVSMSESINRSIKVVPKNSTPESISNLGRDFPQTTFLQFSEGSNCFSLIQSFLSARGRTLSAMRSSSLDQRSALQQLRLRIQVPPNSLTPTERAEIDRSHIDVSIMVEGETELDLSNLDLSFGDVLQKVQGRQNLRVNIQGIPEIDHLWLLRLERQQQLAFTFSQSETLTLMKQLEDTLTIADIKTVISRVNCSVVDASLLKLSKESIQELRQEFPHVKFSFIVDGEAICDIFDLSHIEKILSRSQAPTTLSLMCAITPQEELDLIEFLELRGYISLKLAESVDRLLKDSQLLKTHLKKLLKDPERAIVSMEDFQILAQTCPTLSPILRNIQEHRQNSKYPVTSILREIDALQLTEKPPSKPTQDLQEVLWHNLTHPNPKTRRQALAGLADDPPKDLSSVMTLIERLSEAALGWEEAAKLLEKIQPQEKEAKEKLFKLINTHSNPDIANAAKRILTSLIN